MSSRREGPSRVLDAANGTGTDRRGSALLGRDADDLGENRVRPRSAARFSGREPSTEGGRRTAPSSIPPAPVLPGVDTYRRTTTPRRTPNEVLNRSRRLGRDVKPSTGAPATSDSGTGRQPLPIPPE